MATEGKFIQELRAPGSKTRCSITKTLTVAGNTTVKDSTFTPPVGAAIRGVAIETATAISGTPTTCNVRIGTADTGQQLVADVDAKAQGHIAATLVAAFDKNHACDATPPTLFMQVTTAGGTASAGSIDVTVDFDIGV